MFVYGLSNADAFAPQSKSLALLGWKDAKRIKNNYEYWRFFTPTFLHGSAYHIIANVVSQLFLGHGIEYGIGPWRMAFLYFIAAFGGMLLSCVVKPESYAVGASTSVFGLVGFLISYVFTNWQFMGRTKPWQRIYLTFFTLAIVAVNMNLGPMADGTVDNYGHYGGLLTGFLAGITLSEQYDLQARNKKRIPDRFTREEYNYREFLCNNIIFNFLGHILLTAYFVILLVIFFGYTDVDNIEQDQY